MGIDITHKYDRKTGRTKLVSPDPYMALLVKLYRYLARRTSAKFNKIILKRLMMSRINRRPVSIRRLVKYVNKGTNAKKTLVIVGTVTDDVRVYDVPKMTVCALKVTKGARARILKAGGSVLTFDQLVAKSPVGKNTMLVQGSRSAREAKRHFGASGLPGSHAKPFVRSKGRKFERARGRR